VSSANYDEIQSTYNFAGELTTTTRIHHVGATTTTIANRYEYDHMGRKLATFEKINADPEVVISNLTYNEVGQLLKKSLHSTDGVNFLQNITYAYNPRGWLKKDTASLFSFDLKYEDGTFPQFNGNISNQNWGINGVNPNTYTYKYDALNRLTNGASTGVVMSETLLYDEMGNIKSLVRDGGTAGTYSYIGNKLNQVTGGLTTGLYQYDGNGNATTDGRNGTALTYNQLNLPATVSKSGLTMAYTYDATGEKLRKVSNGVARDYINGIEYNNGSIEIIHTEEGVARRNAAIYSYEYDLSDNLGNVRLSFYKNPANGILEIIQKDDYYPFGQIKIVSAGQNKYLYNGKELQDELGQLDYGARFYDPVIGRWNVIDPMTESYLSQSPYNYAMNDPVGKLDPNGMWVESPTSFSTNDPNEIAAKLRQIAGNKRDDQDDTPKKNGVSIGNGQGVIIRKTSQGYSVDKLTEGDGTAISDLTEVGIGFTPFGFVTDVANAIEGHDRAGSSLSWGWRLAGLVPMVSEFGKFAKGTERLLLKSGKLYKHHVFPQKFREWFVKNGIKNIDEFTIQISRDTHLKGVHGKGLGNLPGRWNQQWADFIKLNPNASPSEIFHHAEGLLKRYGLEHLKYVPYK
jgi:RHS repeat-associated protein